MTQSATDRPLTLMGIPPELRLKIYGFTCQRVTGPKLVLKVWFEHTDQDIDTSQPAPSPFVALHHGTAADDAEDEVEDDDADADADDDGDEVDEEVDDEGVDEETEEEADEDDGFGTNDDDDLDDPNAEESAASDEDEMEVDGATTTSTEAMEDVDDAGDWASAHIGAVRFLSETYVGRVNKYRHLLPIMTVSHCPPPTELLLISPTINSEVMEYSYNILTLEIRPFASIAHTSFFEHVMRTLQTEVHSPLHQIRRAKVVLVWDSAYLQRYHGEDFETDVLRNIASFRIRNVVAALASATKLKSLDLEWHDSSDAGTTFHNEVIAQFQEAFIILNGGTNALGEAFDLQETVTEIGSSMVQKYGRETPIGAFRSELRKIRKSGQQLM